MKGTINAIMDGEVECFPRELDLRIEARHLKNSALPEGNGWILPSPLWMNYRSSAHTDFPDRRPWATADVSDPVVRQKAIHAARTSRTRLELRCSESDFHADPHPGNIMFVGEELNRVSSTSPVYHFD